MLHSFYSQVAIVALVVICGLALWKGAPAERAGASLILITWIITLVASVTTVRGNNLPAVVYLVSDAILAAGLLILAIRYSSWWLGAAMALQAVGLSLHAAYFAADKSEVSIVQQQLYVLGKNLASVAMLLVLLAAVLAGVLQRRRSASARVRAAGVSARAAG
ncbi:MAG: hypothetical protein JWO72_2905 [Caulobacteraceae bacterium]|nr:hypothetical protein [Caulobacteraceae bacterium]